MKYVWHGERLVLSESEEMNKAVWDLSLYSTHLVADPFPVNSHCKNTRVSVNISIPSLHQQQYFCTVTISSCCVFKLNKKQVHEHFYTGILK